MKDGGSNSVRRTRKKKPNATSAWSTNTEHGSLLQTPTNFETKPPTEVIRTLVREFQWRLLTEEEMAVLRANMALLPKGYLERLLHPTASWNSESETPAPPTEDE
jgi:hypothetical protein